ncbi:Tat-binding [Penicillium herquei]|nr:Tat-binding [Penicillium herquei]
MPRGNSKRSLEEIANMSDSNDEDWSETDHRPTSRRGSRKAKGKPSPKKRSRPSKKRRRTSRDIVSDDDDFSDEDDLSIEEESEESDDPNVPRNARGTARRRTTQNHPTYEEGPSDADEDLDAEGETVDETSPKKKSSMVTLRLPPAVLSQPAFTSTRRTTRRTRDVSEDIVALTNSGRHIQTVERGTRSPSPSIMRHVSRGATVPPITEESAMSSEILASMEVLESDVPDVTMEEGVVPESENGDAKNQADADDEYSDDGSPVIRRNMAPQYEGHTEEEAEEKAEPTESEPEPRRSGRKKPLKSSQKKAEDESDFEPEEDDEDDASESERSLVSPQKSGRETEDDSTVGRRAGLRKRTSQSRGQSDIDELAFEVQDLRDGKPRRRVQEETVYEKPRRNRKDVDYRVFRPEPANGNEEAENDAPTESPSRRGRGGGGGNWKRPLFPTSGPFGGTGLTSVLGPSDALAGAGGEDTDSSDDEFEPPKATGLVAQTHSADAQLAGTPANFGKLKDKQTLADADPLGVDMSVNFDSVGGLQGHIDQLKEMVSLPLLYPEIFQRFHIVPPRGVLFHGPPGTGKTLLARALANSVSSEGRKVSFYMRKGADTLSKWVGEAERQLRLLFEEARKNQPSIIFFDEIDGLAPVRSSKQEQIHASIVSTLLALMDGMDGRGQVIVIGATNRPDSVDPALRRPGRFDREFYFPLPNLEGRRAILDIHTKGWDPALPGEIKDELAKITKGYGGADLRALCTEAALNAVQRKYPQIYKSEKKLIINPKHIDVLPKDFMIAVKKMVPSSERSTASGASALPQNVEPLLRQALAEVQKALSEVLPMRKRLTALEEAQYEEPNDGNGFRREQMMQEFDRSRVFRPRMLLRGPQGMGQQYLAAALLHKFEGLHVQAFDLPTLLSDSTRSPEAAVIQLFSEVKRNRPSVIYIPNIQTWFETVGTTVISTFLGLLRSLPPSDPVLLLGVLEAGDDDVDTALLKQLFGFSKKNLFDLPAPDSDARKEFFGRLIEYVKTAPSDFPDPENRKKRQLEELEVAPPPSPVTATPISKEEQKAQKKKDRQTLNLLKIRIQPIMDQIKKYKRFRTGVIEEGQYKYLWEETDPNIVTSDLPPDEQGTSRAYEKAVDKYGVPGLLEVDTGKFFYNMEIVTMEKRLSNGFYKRPVDFLADIKRITKDARKFGDHERLLRANELLSNVEVDIAVIEQAEPALVTECEGVYLRELAREKEAIERARKAEEEVEKLRQEEAAAYEVALANIRPITPAHQITASFSNGYQNGGGSDLNEPGHNGQSNASHGDVDGDVFMSNSEDQSVSKHTQISSFGPSAQPKPLYSHTAPSQQIRRESGLSSFSQKGPVTPMAPGSQPGDYTNEASTTQTTSYKKSSDHSSHQPENLPSPHVSRHDYPDLSQYPDRVSQEEHLPDTQQGGSSQPSPRVHDSLETTQKPQPPLFEAVTPVVTLDLACVGHLHGDLVDKTHGCSVEQLEEINTALMGYVWAKRGEWDRTCVAQGVTETFNEVLEDILAT